MGCVSSKHVKAGTLDVYRPAATSFAVFDINSITEPWLPAKEQQDDEKQKTPSHLPVPIEKLDDDDDDDVVPRPWEEVRKDLEELKPTLNSPTPRQPTAAATPPDTSPSEKKMKRKSFSFHTLEELENNTKAERDISLHGEFRTQLKELLGDSASVPRMFVKGRYIGGVDEIVGLNETGRLRRILSRVGIEKEVGRQACEGCGGARFVPCLECGGSCKIAVDGKKEKERCPECNENGLMYCPMCS
ncbi:putative Thioredoxin-like superfamily [Helianthus debilis subsp. tardiflorus]